jgi:rhamnulokinase
MNHSFAAVDLGATSGRVVLGTFRAGEFLLSEVHRFPNEPIVVDGERCWNHDALFEETLIGLTKAVSRASELDSTLMGIGVDSWGVDYGLVDSNNVLIHPARHYRSAQASVVEQARVAVSSDEAYQRTGIIESPINTSFQFVRDANAGLLDEEVVALLTPDLWTAWLTGERGAERTIASTTGLLDWISGNWAFDLMDRYGIPRTVMPPIVETGSRAGRTLLDTTTRIGSDHPINVYRVGAHDTASAFAAVTDSSEDSIVISCGTWALIGRLHQRPLLDPLAREAGFTNEAAIDGSALVVRNLSGTWLLDECLRHWAKEDGLDDPSSLRAELLAAVDETSVSGTIDCGSDALIGTTNMPAEIRRLYRENVGDVELDRVQTVALILQSLARSFQDTIEELTALSGVTPSRIVMIGGGSRIGPLIRLTKVATQLPVTVSHQEATSIGSICIQAVAAGLFPHIREARAAVNASLTGAEDE